MKTELDILLIHKCCSAGFNHIKDLVRYCKEHDIATEVNTRRVTTIIAKTKLTEEEVKNIASQPIVIINNKKYKAQDWLKFFIERQNAIDETIQKHQQFLSEINKKD